MAYELKSTVLNKTVVLNKNQERELAKMSPSLRDAVAKDWLAANEIQQIAAYEKNKPFIEARIHNKSVASARVTESGYLELSGLGTGRKTYVSKQGVSNLLGMIEQIRTLQASMPETPVFTKSK